jgi:hypothetical protein
VVSAVRGAASELGKPLVVVSTNLRKFTDDHAHWEGYHGSALATVALLLSPRFHKVYIPGTLTYAHLVPLGSHPILDPLWSTEDVSIVHDGCEAARLDKIAEIASSATACRWLRVCWIDEGGAYNCGRCEKCLRTMVAMKALGVLEQFETVPQSIDLSRMQYEDLPFVRYTWEQSLALLESSSPDRRLVRDLRRSLYGPRARVTRRAARYGRYVRDEVAGLLRGWAAAVRAPRNQDP